MDIGIVDGYWLEVLRLAREGADPFPHSSCRLQPAMLVYSLPTISTPLQQILDLPLIRFVTNNF